MGKMGKKFMSDTNHKANLILLITAIIWSLTFVAQQQETGAL